ncbi:MAG: acylneuraminate cytidylyltransferase [Nitrospira sp. CG24E]|nr:MAG: acylneuraminate cytidylyltransferase [Nitrospira sp. CG24E]
MKTPVKAFVQARMSSSRYPGKVLAPFRGEPVIVHVVRAIECVLPSSDIVVTTSGEKSDDPLAEYLDSLGISIYRGPLANVMKRFSSCLEQHPCDWILRISGDSPLLCQDLIRLVVRQAEWFNGDLVTTIFPRTFPQGQNAELIKAGTLRSLSLMDLTPEDQEHVTPYFYRHPERFSITNVESGDRRLAGCSLAVDTVEDLQRLEGLSSEDLRRFMPPIFAAEVTP